MIPTQMIYINKMLKLTQGQGHKIKGQGQICKFVENLFQLYIMNHDDWILMILTYVIDINKLLKLT